MTDVAVKCEVDGISTEDGRSLDELFGDMLMNDFPDVTGESRITPAMVSVESPYGVYVEFGTGPAKTAKPSKKLIDDIAKWMQDKGISGDPRAIAYKIHSEGMLPHPFFRAAVYSILDGIDEDYLDEGGSLLDLCEDISDRAADNLNANRSIATMALRNSMRTDTLEYDFNPDTGEFEPDLDIESESNVYYDPLWEKSMRTMGRRDKNGNYRQGEFNGRL